MIKRVWSVDQKAVLKFFRRDERGAQHFSWLPRLEIEAIAAQARPLFSPGSCGLSPGALLPLDMEEED